MDRPVIVGPFNRAALAKGKAQAGTPRGAAQEAVSVRALWK